jgi:hypothetical protein
MPKSMTRGPSSAAPDHESRHRCLNFNISPKVWFQPSPEARQPCATPWTGALACARTLPLLHYPPQVTDFPPIPRCAGRGRDPRARRVPQPCLPPVALSPIDQEPIARQESTPIDYFQAEGRRGYGEQVTGAYQVWQPRHLTEANRKFASPIFSTHPSQSDAATSAPLRRRASIVTPPLFTTPGEYLPS